MVEILSAALAGGEFMKALTGVSPEGDPQMYGLGHFFFVVDPDAFMGQDTFRKIAGDISRELRASEKAPGEERIYTAGREGAPCLARPQGQGHSGQRAVKRR